MPDVPIACTLTPAEFATRRDTLLPGVVARADQHEPLPDGARWRFTASRALLMALTAMMDAERRCCPFFRFDVLPDPDGRHVWLEVTGPPGTRQYLERLPRR